MSEEAEQRLLGVSPDDLEDYQRSAASREEYQRGQARLDVLRSGTKPEAIKTFVRRLLESYEDPNSIFFHDRYSLAYAYRTLEDRKAVFELTNEDLNRLGIKEQKLAGFALRVKEEKKEVEEWEKRHTIDKEGKVKTTRQGKTREVIRQIPYYGTDEERRELSVAMKEVQEEILSRWKFNETYRGYLEAAGTLSDLAKLFFTPLSSLPLTPDFKRTFSLPEAGATSERPHDFGDKIDKAMRAYAVIGLSERPTELNRLRNTPGWKILFPTKEEEEEWVGKIDQWPDRLDAKGNVNLRASLLTEPRGLLTRQGNIFTMRESSEQRDEIRGAVRKLLGGDVAAEELAWRFIHLFGIAAENGGQDFVFNHKTGQYEKKPNIEGFPAADDFVKLFQFRRWQEKQTGSGHSGGPKKTRGKYGERLLVNLLRFANCYMEKDSKGQLITGSRRSFWELWWKGYPGKQALRLGDEDFPWDKVNIEILRDYFLRIFINGRREQGLFEILTRVAWKPEELTNTVFWEDMNKFINVIVNEQLIANGEFEGRSEEDIKKLVDEWKRHFKDTFWKGIKETRDNHHWLHTVGGGGFRSETTQATIEKFQKLAGY